MLVNPSAGHLPLEPKSDFRPLLVPKKLDQLVEAFRGLVQTELKQEGATAQTVLDNTRIGSVETFPRFKQFKLEKNMTDELNKLAKQILSQETEASNLTPELKQEINTALKIQALEQELKKHPTNQAKRIEIVQKVKDDPELREYIKEEKAALLAGVAEDWTIKYADDIAFQNQIFGEKTDVDDLIEKWDFKKFRKTKEADRAKLENQLKKDFMKLAKSSEDHLTVLDQANGFASKKSVPSAGVFEPAAGEYLPVDDNQVSSAALLRSWNTHLVDPDLAQVAKSSLTDELYRQIMTEIMHTILQTPISELTERDQQSLDNIFSGTRMMEQWATIKKAIHHPSNNGSQSDVASAIMEAAQRHAARKLLQATVKGMSELQVPAEACTDEILQKVSQFNDRAEKQTHVESLYKALIGCGITHQEALDVLQNNPNHYKMDGTYEVDDIRDQLPTSFETLMDAFNFQNIDDTNTIEISADMMLTLREYLLIIEKPDHFPQYFLDQCVRNIEDTLVERATVRHHTTEQNCPDALKADAKRCFADYSSAPTLEARNAALDEFQGLFGPGEDQFTSLSYDEHTHQQLPPVKPGDFTTIEKSLDLLKYSGITLPPAVDKVSINKYIIDPHTGQQVPNTALNNILQPEGSPKFININGVQYRVVKINGKEKVVLALGASTGTHWHTATMDGTGNFTEDRQSNFGFSTSESLENVVQHEAVLLTISVQEAKHLLAQISMEDVQAAMPTESQTTNRLNNCSHAAALVVTYFLRRLFHGLT